MKGNGMEAAWHGKTEARLGSSIWKRVAGQICITVLLTLVTVTSTIKVLQAVRAGRSRIDDLPADAGAYGRRPSSVR